MKRNMHENNWKKLCTFIKIYCFNKLICGAKFCVSVIDIVIACKGHKMIYWLHKRKVVYVALPLIHNCVVCILYLLHIIVSIYDMIRSLNLTLFSIASKYESV